MRTLGFWLLLWGWGLGLAACVARRPPVVLGTPTPTPFRPVYTTPTRSPVPHRTPRPWPTASPSPAEFPTPTPWLRVPFPYPSQPPRKPWPTPSQKSITPVPEPFPRILTDTRTWTVLLLGSDFRGRSYRTDVLLFVAVRPETGTVSLISFPRDLYVYIPGWHMDRINTAYFWGEYSGYPGGGPQAIRDTFLYNFGLRVDRIALVDFEGFRRIVDALGGIDVPVACAYTDWRLKHPDLNPQDPANWELYTVHPGLVHMDGEMALWYVRARLRSSDYSRHRRQQEVLFAIKMALQKPENWLRLPQLFQIFRTYVRTDITWQDVLPFLPLLPRLDFAHVHQYRLAPPLVVSWRTPSGGVVLLPRRGRISDLLEEALAPQLPTVPETAAIVVVQNASGKPGWDILAAWRLQRYGYATVLVDPRPTPIPASRLIPLHEQGKAEARDLLRVLGLPDTAFSQKAPSDEVFRGDWLFLVGPDYQTCFEPAQLGP